MEIYNTNNKNVFYTFISIDNKEIELDFVLTVENHFYCDCFIQTQKDKCNKTYSGILQYNFNENIFKINSCNIINLTNRQIKILKKKIKLAYMEILKIKFDDIVNDGFLVSDKQIEEYEKYRKYIDKIVV